MAINDFFFPNGLGAATGDELVTSQPWYTSDTVIYVSNLRGDDGNVGTERLQPKKTIASAVTAISATNGIIVLAADFSETVIAEISLGNNVTIVGEGNSSGTPTAQITFNMAASVGISIPGTDCQLRNILFPPRDQTNSSPRVQVAVDGGGDRALIKDCVFQSNSTDSNSNAVDVAGASDVVFDGCTFVVTGFDTDEDPAIAGLMLTTPEAGLRIVDCTFDGGTTGYADGIALNNPTNIATFLSIERLSLLNGADVRLQNTATGRISMASTTGSGRLIFETP